MHEPNPTHKIVIFLALTVLFCAAVYIPILRSGELGFYTIGLMWAPGVAAMLTQWFTEGTLAGLGWRWGRTRYQVISFLLPLLLCIVVYGLFWAAGLVPFTSIQLVETVAAATGLEMALPLALLLTVLVGFPSSLLTATGEEIGWRGLLVPELAKQYNFSVTSLTSGVIWALFHYPAILFADYNSSAPRWYAMTMFTIMAITASFVFAWLRLKSGSLWTAAILHASHNLFIQAIFYQMTLDFGLTPYLTTEFGVGLAAAYTLVAIYCWTRRKEVERVVG